MQYRCEPQDNIYNTIDRDLSHHCHLMQYVFVYQIQMAMQLSLQQTEKLPVLPK